MPGAPLRRNSGGVQIYTQLPTPLGPSGANFALSFQDEFAGPDGTPDMTKWTFVMSDGLHDGDARGDAVNRPTNNIFVSAAQGGLVLRTTNANLGFGIEKSVGLTQTNSFRFGPNSVISCRAKIRAAGTPWFGFWGVPDNGMHNIGAFSAIDGTEVDVAETYNADTVARSNIHWNDYGSDPQQAGQVTCGALDLAVFHDFTLWWSSAAGGSYKFYTDGVLTRTYTTNISTRTDNPILLSHEYINTMGTISPDFISVVDYVRAWSVS